MGFSTFDQCFAHINATEELWRVGGRDHFGNPVTSLDQLKGMSYDMCVSVCGSSSDEFNLQSFSTQFSTFFIPFLALTAQLPFGSSNRSHNFSSIALTLGSPMLAIFSLSITLLNSAWLHRRFAGISYPNTHHAVVVLNNLQQSLLRVQYAANTYPLLASLVVLPQNDEWWELAARKLSFTHTWTPSNILNTLWVVLTYIFTLTELNIPSAEKSLNIIGPATSSSFIWLLPLVVGWLIVSPNCDQSKLRKKFKRLHETVFVAVPGSRDPELLSKVLEERYPIMVWPSTGSYCREDDDDIDPDPMPSIMVSPSDESYVRGDDGRPWPHEETDACPNHSTSRVFHDIPTPSGLTALPLHDLSRRRSSQTLLGTHRAKTVSAQRAKSDWGGDESRSSPIYNYARIFPWARSAELLARTFETASAQYMTRLTVDGSPWQHSQSSDTLIHPECRKGTAAQLNAYMRLEASPSGAMIWGPEVWMRVIRATFIAFIVQGLCFGAAIMTSVRTPTTGLGCHSGSFILHEMLATLCFMSIMASEVLKQYDHPTTPQHLRRQRSWVRQTANVLNTVGKVVGWVNGLLFISLAILSFSNLFYTCYCSGSVLGRGHEGAYITMLLDGDPGHVLKWWIAGVAIATTTAGLFWLFSYYVGKKTRTNKEYRYSRK